MTVTPHAFPTNSAARSPQPLSLTSDARVLVPLASNQHKMRAIQALGYGSTDVLRLTSMPRPVPGRGELLVRVRATSVTAADGMMRRGDPAYARLFLGLIKPRHAVPGTGFSGVVEAVGAGVSQFPVGKAVFGETGVSFGAHAEYVCVAEEGVVLLKPEALPFEEAAVLCDGPVTSLNFLRRLADLKAGQRVLINGASGSLGTAAVQLAKHLGAEVTGVCGPSNLEMVRSLGASHVIDYTKEDYSGNGLRYDVIYDTVGKSSFGRCKNSLTSRGKYLSPVLSGSLLFQMGWTRLFGQKRALFDATGMRPVSEMRAFLTEVAALATCGELQVLIEKTYSLDEIAQAHAHVEHGHKKGNVVIRVAER